MKNLKKVLAFALVVCMMLSTIVSATAISATDYTDYESITNADAVAVLSELGVINGYPTGDFKPAKTVSRAEMAKMITVVLNKGTDAAANYDGAQVFTDVYADMWCKGYINYCNTLGIVVGMGDGTFKPNQGVTVVQTAKMLLVAMGYDPVTEGFEGANWDVKVNAIAAAAGLYNGVKANAAAECSRDNAALIIYNALVANMVDGYVNGKAVVGEQTMLGKYFNAVVVKGVVVANDYANLFGSSALYNAKYNSTELAILGTQYVDDNDPVDPGIEWFEAVASSYESDNLNWLYNYGIGDDDYSINFNTSYVKTYGNNDYYESQIFQVGTTLAQVGQTVKVVAKLKDNYEYYYKNGVRYSEYVFTGEVIGNVMDVDCVVKELDGDYNYFSTTDLKKEGVVFDSDTRYFMNYSAMWVSYGLPQRYSFDNDLDAVGFYYPSAPYLYNEADSIFFNADGAYTKFVDVDGDGKIEIVLQWRPFFAIADYDTYYKTFTFEEGYAEGIDPDDIICDEELDDGDYVLVVPVDGKYYVEICETKKVTVDKVGINNQEAYIVDSDGVTYSPSGLYWSYDAWYYSDEAASAGLTPPDRNELYWSLNECDTDTDYNLYFDSYGNVVAYKEAKGGPPSDAYAMVTSSYCYNKYSSSVDEEYQLSLVKPSATKESDALVQWFGTRYPYADKEAMAFFTDDIDRDVVDLNSSFYPASIWRTRSAYRYTGSYYGYDIIDGQATDIKNVYSLGLYTALITAEYDDEGDVDVSEPSGGPPDNHESLVLFDEKALSSSTLRYTYSAAVEDDPDGSSALATYNTPKAAFATDDTVFFIYQYGVAASASSYQLSTFTVKDAYSVTGTDNLPTIDHKYVCDCESQETPHVESDKGNACNSYHYEGITAAYGIVKDKTGEILAMVIETNATIKKKVTGWFVYNYELVTKSKQDVIYRAHVITDDGEDKAIYVYGYDSDMFITEGRNTYYRYGLFAVEESGDTYNDEPVYILTIDDNYDYQNIYQEDFADFEFTSSKSYIYFNGNPYYITSATTYFFRCEVDAKNNGVTDYQLVETTFDNIEDYAASVQVIYNWNAGRREIIAVVGGVANPIVYYPNTYNDKGVKGVYAEAGSQWYVDTTASGYDASDSSTWVYAEYAYVSMYNDYTLQKGTIGYFIDRVAKKANAGGEMAPPPPA